MMMADRWLSIRLPGTVGQAEAVPAAGCDRKLCGAVSGRPILAGDPPRM